MIFRRKNLKKWPNKCQMFLKSNKMIRKSKK